MAKKLIGIVGYKNYEQNSFGAGITYLEWLSEFGDVVILMPHEELADVDLVFMPGGLDTAPSNYGEVPRYKTSNQDVFKEFFLKERLKNYIEASVPVFGTCLGFQQIATYFGSKLCQNLKWHEQSKDRWETAHKIKVVSNLFDGTQLFIANGKKNEIEVNSHHHQGLLKSGMSDSLQTVAVAYNHDNPADPLVEAFVHKELPVAAVQYHPEELYDSYSANLMHWLLKD